MYKPGHGCEVVYKDKVVGQIGEVSSQVKGVFGLKKDAAVATIDISQLLALLPRVNQTYAEISKYQKSLRDISITLSKNIAAEKVLDVARTADSLIQSVEIIDIYEGKNIATNEKSITIRLEIFSFEKTMTENDVENAVKLCQNKLIKLGGNLRGAKS